MLYSAIGIIILLCVCMLVSCRSPKYVPIERVQKEYIDRFLRDSIYIHDSIHVEKRGDTLTIYKDKYLYRNIFLRDTLRLTDSIPYPVTEYRDVVKEVNKKDLIDETLILLGKLFLALSVLWIVKKKLSL
jgi:hypothetical protein